MGAFGLGYSRRRILGRRGRGVEVGYQVHAGVWHSKMGF